MGSELRICFRENKNKKKEPISKTALSGKFFSMFHRRKNCREIRLTLWNSWSQIEAALEFFLENSCTSYDRKIALFDRVIFKDFLSS